MGWNEPPNNNQGKDPWGNRGNGEGPPDLDELVKKMQQGFGGIFGKKPDSFSSPGSPMLWVFLVLGILLWLAYDMTYAIDQQERGVVLRFGKYVTTMEPGLNIRLPQPVERVMKVNVGQVRPLTHRATMLTQDENIVDVDVAVKWRINDPYAYLFNVYDPVSTIRQATESAVREIIGKSKLDYVLTEGRSDIAQRQQDLLQSILEDYKTGILVVNIEMQSAKPPEQVKDAFDDAIKAREDEQRLVNEAEAYRNDIIPRARGKAARLREESNAYKARVIARAEGEASRFDQQLAEYQRAPDITRQRLYLEAMEGVFSNTSKILIDSDGNNSLMYLPVDQLIKNRTGSAAMDFGRSLQNSSGSDVSRSMQDNLTSRSRGVR
ncbi:MAG: FtsH protease activity modulator HflK [Thiotrichales bacterium]|nr:FtsH protease activity modulator HflK [Thiotrichales bacterium]